ncbi:GGDEF domain-containing protein [Succinivibrio dextrinosolvens]|uniref:GGDEF domain-containing protein n=1 Tax=Succinivibrio dextrinosolvens TaxID=83771 RepID=UPI0009424F05|nr:GGDEF domain-containing protein [Succinivibrio dextrinosolvens]
MIIDVFELVSVFFPFSSFFFLHSLIVCVEIVLWIYLPYVCLRLIIWRFLDQRYFKIAFIRNLMLFPLIITTFLSVLSLFNNFLFKLNLFGEALAGEYFFIVEIFVLLYTLAGLCICFYCIFSENNSSSKSKLLVAAFFVALLGGIQYTFGFFMNNLYIVAATLSVVFLYVTAQENRIFIDPLTGLNNRNRFRIYLSSILSNYVKVNMYLTYVDIDDFKRINDEHGHIVGDLALRVVAESMLDLSRKFNYFIARIGGDEFAIISSHTSVSDVDLMISDIKNVLKQKAKMSLPDVSVNLSFGTTNLNQTGKTLNEITRMADNNMYTQKRANKQGRNMDRENQQ